MTAPLRRVRVIGGEHARNLQIIDCETGQPVRHVSKAELSITPAGAVIHLTITCSVIGLDLVAHVAGEPPAVEVPVELPVEVDQVLTVDPLAAALKPRPPAPPPATVIAPAAPWPFPKTISGDFKPLASHIPDGA